ncbi:hypothetical protein [Mangrovimonas sp. ST2L15]|uniref:hypothetical protein n=1 Tax=Mangrovimonas sp. ST2L15 TaxID=1645916 RepID=UPI0006B4305A|nr:hypothetical protein [Mangrovimonas sp. ST2L15]
MLEYLKFLFSKVKSFDKKLQDISFLLDKTWIRITPDGFNEKWFFRKNGLLTISQNGNIIDGKFDLLNNYLLLEFLGKKILLNKSLIYNEILLLKKDSNDSELYAFYNEAKFSPEDFLKHLNFSRNTDLNIKKITLIDNTIAEIIREPSQKGISKGNLVWINDQLCNEDYIETDYNYYNLTAGEITEIFYKRKFQIFDNPIVIKQKWKKLSINDSIISFNQKVSNGLHKINFKYGIEVENNIIKKTYHISYWKTIIKKRKLEIWSKTSDDYSIGDLVRENDNSIEDGNYWIGLIEVIKVKHGKIY